MILVVGTGRSGTHFLTSCLLAHPEVTDLTGGNENPIVFATAVRLATGRQQPGDAANLVSKYGGLLRDSGERVLLDQTHPNLWNFEILSSAFPQASWVGLVRDPRAVVASMLQHPGVRARAEEWRTYPLPNRFLGVTTRNRERYEDASLAGRCAFRWLSHVERTLELASSGSLRPLSFERLIQDTSASVASIWADAGLVPVPNAVFAADVSTLDRWVEVLEPAQIDEVVEIATQSSAYAELRSILGDDSDLHFFPMDRPSRRRSDPLSATSGSRSVAGVRVADDPAPSDTRQVPRGDASDEVLPSPMTTAPGHVILHLGAHKTGTSLIQKFLRDRPHEATRLGLGAISRADGDRLFAWGGQTLKMQEETRGQVDSLFRSGRRHVIVSHENALGRPFVSQQEHLYPKCAERSRDLAAVFSPFDVTVIFYIRDQATFLQSYYLQTVHQGSTDTFREWLAPIDTSKLSWVPMVTALTDAFGPARVAIADFSEIGAGQEQFLRTFISRVDRSLSPEIDYPVRRNPSIGDLGLDIALALNAHVKSQTERKAARVFLQKNYSNVDFERPNLLTHEETAELGIRYGPENLSLVRGSRA